MDRSIGYRIIAAMDAAGTDCPSLARLLGVRVDVVYHWRNGSTVPRTRTVGEIADALGCSCDYIIRGRT